MAFSSTTDIEVRQAGNDGNGGAWDTASSGTDFSLQDSPQVTYTDLVIDGATNTNCTSAAFPFGATHVGNVINITSGTGFTVQRVRVVSVAGVIATCDKSLGTLGSTGGNGKLGGGLATIGAAGLVLAAEGVAGSRIWVKYHATAYSATSTSSNVANGRLLITIGTLASPCVVRGYETTHGDQTANMPTFRWGVNAAGNALVALGSASVCNIENLILDCNQANFTSTRGLVLNSTGQVFVRRVKIMSASSSAVVISGVNNNHFFDCEITGCVTATAISVTVAANVYMNGCYVHDNTVDGYTAASTGQLFAFRCVFDTNKSTTTKSHVVLAAAARIYAAECVFYNAGSHGVDLQVDTYSYLVDCLFEANGGYDVNCAAAGVHDGVMLYGCGFYPTGTGKYDGAKILAAQVTSEKIASGTFFTDAAGGDFTLNNTASQGALVRATGWPSALMGATGTNYADVGAFQSQAAAAAPSGGGPLIVDGISSLILT